MRAPLPVMAALARLWRTFGGRWHWYALWLAHHKYIVGVTGVVQDGEGRVLLLRHRFWADGTWGLPGGYARAGESLGGTLEREVREETGLEVEALRPLRLVSGYRLRLEVHFLARLHGGTLRLDPTEVLEASFFAPDALPVGLLPDHLALVAQVCRERAMPAS